jgi:GntR family transcriptional regulator
MPIRQPSLADQVYEIILKEISSGGYPPGSLLPSENQLAERFSVSRPTIRAAFARLLERGYVKRRRGIGTYVADLPSIVNPLYQLLDIHERITARGFTPGFKQLSAEITPADEYISTSLDIEKGSPVLNVHKIFTANEIPIIYFVNFVPVWVFEKSLSLEEAVRPGVTEPFFTFFSDLCKHPIRYLASTVKPQIMKNCLCADKFDFDDPDMMVLEIEDIGYNETDTPIFLSLEHLTKEASTLHIIRYVENI